MLSINALSDLGRYRWTVPLMALVAERRGTRFAEMAHRLGLSRESLTRTLEAAGAAGWIVRNSGHGHPLRPEYVPTAEGLRIGEACRAIVATQAQLGLAPDALSRWSLPILRLIADGHGRFNAIARALDAANPRAMTASLRGLVELDLVDRRVLAGFPPTSAYALTARGGVLADSLPLAA
ncbi:MAG: winged helix-turn-helix transcriptional regulator [Sphingobium sp.]